MRAVQNPYGLIDSPWVEKQKHFDDVAADEVATSEADGKAFVFHLESEHWRQSYPLHH